MAKARSPQYPSIGLKEAIEKIGAVYKKDYQNKVPRDVVAKHMGYESLHGKALGVLSTLGKYGLLEGRGDESRVSDLAVKIIAHEEGSPERAAAINESALKPELFAEIEKRFGPKVSDTALRSYLLTQKFIPTAADSAIRAYRETKQLVEAESEGYIEPVKQEQSVNLSDATTSLLDRPASSFQAPAAKGRMLQEVFNLDEGPVTLNFPEHLSAESYEDLKDHLDLFLRKAKRQADRRAREEFGKEE
jgi:hypothetical protein